MENKKVEELLKECIEEQKQIGLMPIDKIEIYLGSDPITKTRCPSNIQAFSIIGKENERSVIIVQKKYFNSINLLQKKSLIHHELIHLNIFNNKRGIEHIKDWKDFAKISEKIKAKYGYDTLANYDIECFKYNQEIPFYNNYCVCPNCGNKTYYVLNKNKKYNFNGNCHNCGHKLIYKQRSKIGVLKNYYESKKLVV